MHNHWLFIANVFAHLVASMSGIASFVFATIEHVRGKKIESRAFFAVGVLCLVIAFDQAWQDEHNNVKVLIGEKSSLWQERDFWKGQSYDKDASLRKRDELLTTNYGVLAQAQSALATLSNRLLDVARPGPLRTEVLRWRVPVTFADARLGRAQFWILVLISNRAVSPVKGTMTCDAPFATIETRLLTKGTFFLAGVSQPTVQSVHVEFMFPPWSAQNPMVLAAYTQEGKEIQTCSFKLD